MKRWKVRFLAALVGLLIAHPAHAQEQPTIEAGMLTCDVSKGVAFILSSPRDLHCVFHKASGQNEAYRGTLQDFGANIGVSGRGVIAWTVLTSTTRLPPGELKGVYGGVEAGAAIGLGGRGQLLIGGSRRTISLQPLSVEGEIGVNLAVGITSMTLQPLFRGRPKPKAAPLPAVGYSYDDVPYERQTRHYGCGSYTHLQRGQTLYGIAHQCGVTVEALLDANPQITNVRKISDGALVRLPSHIGHHAASPCGDSAVLEKNESLDHLSWRCGVTLHTVLRANPDLRSADLIEAGLVIKIPERRQPAAEAPIVWAKAESDLPPLERVSSRRSNDTVVPGAEFNATGEIACARSRGQSMTRCRFGVNREGNGNGWIKIFWPDRGSRVLFFEAGTPTSYDESQADAGAKMTVGRDRDLFKIRVGEQRFEFPHIVITGD